MIYGHNSDNSCLLIPEYDTNTLHVRSNSLFHACACYTTNFRLLSFEV